MHHRWAAWILQSAALVVLFAAMPGQGIVEGGEIPYTYIVTGLL